MLSVSLCSASGALFHSLLAQVTDRVAPVKEDLKAWVQDEVPRKLGLRSVVDGAPEDRATTVAQGSTGRGVSKAEGGEGVEGNPATCKLCELVVAWAENQLAKNKTRQEIIANLDKVRASWRVAAA